MCPYNVGQKAMRADLPWRKFRYIESRDDGDLEFDRVTAGWIQKAEVLRPGAPKALLDGDLVVRLPHGAQFREISFKAEHTSVESALVPWAEESRRRWARVVDGDFCVSDGTKWSATELSVVQHRQPHAPVDVASMPWLQRIADETKAELKKGGQPVRPDNAG